MIKLTAAIILYHYDGKIINNAIELSKLFRYIIVFDNNEEAVTNNAIDELKKINNVFYFSKNKNKGLAYGLNYCCNRALKMGNDWIVLLDQDSKMSKEDIEKMEHFILKEDMDGTLGIAASAVKDNWRVPKQQKVKRKDVVITSGMFLKLSAFKEVGLFNQKLFLYYVDFDYCLRMREKKYRILQNMGVIMEHNCFDDQDTKGGYKVNKYTAIRHYYSIRNWLYMKRRFPKEKAFLERERENCKERIEEMIYFDSGRCKKVLALLLGILDYYRKKFGECGWKFLY